MKNNIFTILFFLSLLVAPISSWAEDPLTLEASIDTALKNSNVIQAAREGVNAAQAQRKEAATGFLPKFSTSYSYTRLNEAPFSKFGSLPPPLTPLSGVEFTTGTKDNFNWSVEARQPLYAGGGILANYEASKIGEETARMEEDARRQDIVLEVKVAYYNILRAKKILTAANQSVELLLAHRNVAENFFKVGMIPKNDLLYAEVELANGRQNLIKAQNALELACVRFNTVLKRNIYAPVDVVDILGYSPFNQSLENCYAQALQNRPEVKISAMKVRQAEKLVKLAKSEYLPALNIVGNYSRFGDNPSVSGSNYKDMESWYLMGVASWNFWEWGKTNHRVEASKARENQFVYAAKELNDQVALEIKNAYLVLQEAEKQINVSRLVIEQAQENFRISEERYKERVATTTEVLDAQTLLTRAKSDYANALGDYNISLARLQRAMGMISR